MRRWGLPSQNALVEEVLSHKFDYLKEEPMASTLTVDWKKDNTVPPRNNDEVARIMQVESVTRRHAYAILRRRSEASVDISTVSEGQRVAVLGTLINDHAARKDVHCLIEELHAIGVKIDGHDVTKTLFALQRQGFVRFRERNQPRTLYAIVVTNAGLDAWAARKSTVIPWVEAAASVALDESPEGAHTAKPSDNHALFVDPNGKVFDPVEERDPRVVSAIENARKLQQEVIAQGAGPRTVVTEDYIKRPWPKGDLSGWPEFSSIRDRARRAKKLNAAAKLLEEVGGHDDAVLTIMVETQFTDLENEALNLLTLFGEIE